MTNQKYKMTTGIFTFFKAGQGAFYAGRIHNNRTGKSYTIVYDCGTSRCVSGNRKSLSNEIEYFTNDWQSLPFEKNKTDKPIIDILFISHTDEDHVSGIKQLLKTCRIDNHYQHH